MTSGYITHFVHTFHELLRFHDSQMYQKKVFLISFEQTWSGEGLVYSTTFVPPTALGLSCLDSETAGSRVTMDRRGGVGVDMGNNWLSDCAYRIPPIPRSLVVPIPPFVHYFLSFFLSFSLRFPARCEPRMSVFARSLIPCTWLLC